MESAICSSFIADLSEKVDRYPSMKFYPSKSNKEFDEVIKKGVVIKDDLNSGAMLTNQYPVLDSTWMPRALSNNLYIVDPPDSKWRADVLSQGQVILGDVSFPVAPFDPPSHDGGYDPIQIWLNIRGFPLMLWLHVEFRRLAEELGGFLVEVDPRSSGHHDFTVLRIKIGVPKVDIVPKFRRLHFVSDNENHKYYDLFIDLESSSHDRGTSQPLQYWQTKKTGEEVSGLEEAVSKEDSIVNMLIIGEKNLNASSSNQSNVRDKNSFSVLAEIDTSAELYIETWDPRTDLPVENSNKEKNGNEGDKKNEKKRCDRLKVMEKPPLPPEPRHSAGLKRKDPIAKEGTRKGTKLKESLPTPSGTDSLVEVFSFSHFSDIEVVQLMESSGFSLGSVLEDKLCKISILRGVFEVRC